jgi:hypothetical protein
MQMIRQHHHRHNLEWMTVLDHADGFTQPVHQLDQQCAFSFRQESVLGFISFSPTYAG